MRAAVFVALGFLTSIAQADAQPAAASKISTHDYFAVNGAKLYVESFGKGTPVLFLHGGLMFFDNANAKQRDYFAAHHRHAARAGSSGTRAPCGQTGASINQ